MWDTHRHKSVLNLPQSYQHSYLLNLGQSLFGSNTPPIAPYFRKAKWKAHLVSVRHPSLHYDLSQKEPFPALGLSSLATSASEERLLPGSCPVSPSRLHSVLFSIAVYLSAPHPMWHPPHVSTGFYFPVHWSYFDILHHFLIYHCVNGWFPHRRKELFHFFFNSKSSEHLSWNIVSNFSTNTC